MVFDNIKGSLLLAPMAGITDLPFRLLCYEYGCPMAFTEMVSAKGLMMNPKQYLINGTSASRLIMHLPIEKLGVQIFGSDPDCMADAAALLSERGFECIDINMGCPAPKITSGGEGSALLKTPDLAVKIAKAVVNSSKIPVTIKMRTGWDRNHYNCIELAQAFEQCGVIMITVHGRTREDFYQGKADLDIIRRTVQAVHIPVIGNGDIRTPQDAAHMLRETGCHAVMIGRGAQGNPFIFKQHKNLLDHGSYNDSSLDTRIDTAIRHLRMLAVFCGEHMAVLEMRKHAAWYIRGAKNATEIRRRVNAVTTMDDMINEMYNGTKSGEN